jgi:antirestriction protein
MGNTISNTDDIIDLRNVMARVEELETALQEAMDANEEGHNLDTLDEYIAAVRQDFSAAHAHRMIGEAKELEQMQALLEECKGNGGDEQWRGDWYPVTLVRDSYFQEYAQELAEDIGAINADATWPNNGIDWEHAARELRMDYTGVEFDGQTYYCR